jgi:hypothetical protein
VGVAVGDRVGLLINEGKGMSRPEWIGKAVEQYMMHGVTRERATLWAESILNNVPESINNCPYITAEIDYRS